MKDEPRAHSLLRSPLGIRLLALVLALVLLSIGGVTAGNLWSTRISVDPAASQVTGAMAWAAVVGVLAGLAAWHFTRSIVAPICRAADLAEAIGDGDLSVRLGLERNDELGRLGRALDRLAERLSQEVVARQATQQQLESQVKLLDALMAALPTPVFYKGTDGRYLGCNQAFADMCGVAIESIKGLTPTDIWDEASASQISVQDDGLLHGERSVSGDLMITDRRGRSHTVILNKARFFKPDGSLAGIIGVLVDISERKRTEMLLRKVDRDLRLAATAFETQEAIFITDAKGQVLLVNAAFSEISGYARDEVVGTTPQVLQPDGLYAETIGRGLSMDGRWQGEILGRRKNGLPFPQLLSLTAVKDGEGQVCNFVGAFTDLSELKAQQERIQRLAFQEQALSSLLQLALEPIDLSAFLTASIEGLFDAVPWLAHPRRAAIFMEEEGEDGLAVMRLAAASRIDLPDGAACTGANGPLCFCRQAADTRDLVFAEMGCSWLTDWDGGSGIPRYHVPILTGETVVGALVVYVDDSWAVSNHDTQFLRRAADVLSMGISHRRAKAEVVHLAFHDALTELPNRRMLLDRLAHELSIAARLGIFGAVLFIDLDNFKNLNDALGHSTGDALLVQVAKRLADGLRESDTVARLGGDEFIVLLPGLSDDVDAAARSAQGVAAKLRGALCAPYDLGGHIHHLTPSIGVALFPHDAKDSESLLKHADTAMYHSKADGRNCIRFFQPAMQETAQARLQLESEMRQALARSEFSLVFQPLSGPNGQIVGAEALIRWHHPERGWVPPAEFVPLSEETGLIIDIGNWVLRHAALQLKAWQDEGLLDSSHHLAINISPKQFHQPEFVSGLEAILAETGASPHHLILEITEGLLIKDTAAAIVKMERLRAMGIRFYIDDFGTGYSSMSYLKRLPVDGLKIDQSFVQDLTTNPNDAAIIEAIIAMARRFNLSVVAEGVETASQLSYLQVQNCDLFQGYYFSRPLAAEAFAKHFLAHNALGIHELGDPVS